MMKKSYFSRFFEFLRFDKKSPKTICQKCLNCTIWDFLTVTLMSQLCKKTTKLMPCGCAFFYSVAFLTKFLLKNRVK